MTAPAAPKLGTVQASEGGPPAVVFEEVSKFYGEVLGVNRVTLNIPPGITSLVGPNGAGMVAGFLLWLLVLSLVAMASSAYVKWRIVAGAVSLAFFFILTGVSEMIDQVFRVKWGHVLDPAWAVNRVWCTLLGVDPPEGPGFGASMLSLTMFVLLLVLVIERKLRPVEVVR